MLCKTRRDVMKAVKERNVSFIQIWFTDVLGYLKSFAITTSELEEALEEGMGFDGSSIEGFARIEESNMIAKPDPTTFEFLPWRGIEFRSPDLACNPYLAFSVMLAAGLKGIEEGYPLPEPIEEDIYHFSPEKREELNIQELPGSLNEAISEMEKSELVREALGDHIFYKFIENKMIEWDQFRVHVSQYEIEKYLPRL